MAGTDEPYACHFPALVLLVSGGVAAQLAGRIAAVGAVFVDHLVDLVVVATDFGFFGGGQRVGVSVDVDGAEGVGGGCRLREDLRERGVELLQRLVAGLEPGIARELTLFGGGLHVLEGSAEGAAGFFGLSYRRVGRVLLSLLLAG